MAADFLATAQDYMERLKCAFARGNGEAMSALAADLQLCWKEGRKVFICGNGGSAANALHMTNDLVYGIGSGKVPGLRAHALSSNVSVLSCLANDLGYEQVFAFQLRVQASAGDLLIVLSGSGNSANIVVALETARELGLASYAVLGYTGGKALKLADRPIHFPVDDMQIAEDLQLMLGHCLMQWLAADNVIPAEAKEHINSFSGDRG